MLMTRKYTQINDNAHYLHKKLIFRTAKVQSNPLECKRI